MKTTCLIFTLLTALTAHAADMELTFREPDLDNLSKCGQKWGKEFLLCQSESIIKNAHGRGIQIYKKDLEDANCGNSDGVNSSVCTVYGDQFSPNSDTIWAVIISSPNAPSCDYYTKKVTFVFLSGEC